MNGYMLSLLIVICSGHGTHKHHRVPHMNITNKADYSHYKDQFRIMPDSYFEKYYIGGAALMTMTTIGESGASKMHINSSLTLPASFSYRDANLVTTPRSQGTTSLCTVFAAIAALETSISHAHPEIPLTELSEQAVYDCLPGDFPMTADKPLEILKTHGTSKLQQCKWGGGPKHECSQKNTEFKIKSFEILELSEEDVKNYLFNRGPLIITLNSSTRFRRYSEGLMDNSFCPPPAEGRKQTRHSVLLVGYGVENGEEYLEFKNSWGTTWGRDGFARFRAGINFCDYRSNLVVSIDV